MPQGKKPREMAVLPLAVQAQLGALRRVEALDDQDLQAVTVALIALFKADGSAPRPSAF